MSDNKIHVSIDMGKSTKSVGMLYCHGKSADFEYEKDWLTDPEKFALEPALSLTRGAQHTERSLFGAFGDSAPDRWGRDLMKHAEAVTAKKESRPKRTLTETDFLLGVDDKTRMGALRFSLPAEPNIYLANDAEPIPRRMDLHKLLAASQNILTEKEKEKDLKLLLQPGSSLGGARAKAAVEDGGTLYIAKFPQKKDEHNIILWEYITLKLAKAAKITVPDYQHICVPLNKTPYDILLLKRFDRNGKRRIPFLSAMSMLGAADMEGGHSYLELADALSQFGAEPKADLEELWRRIVFTVLVSNTDNHLRNHAFLYSHSRGGWRLSPAYDMNPNPDSRLLSLTITESGDKTAGLDLAFEAAEYFGIKEARQKEIVREVAAAVQTWRATAKKHGVSQKEIDYMADAFEHSEAGQAAKL